MKSHRNLKALASVMTLALVAATVLPVPSFAAKSGGRGGSTGTGNGGTGSVGGPGSDGGPGGRGNADNGAWALTKVVPPNCDGNYCRNPRRPIPVMTLDRRGSDCVLRRFETAYGDTIIGRVCDNRFY